MPIGKHLQDKQFHCIMVLASVLFVNIRGEVKQLLERGKKADRIFEYLFTGIEKWYNKGNCFLNFEVNEVRNFWLKTGIFCLVFIVLLSGCSAGSQGAANENPKAVQDGKPMTLMVYMVGSDLEAATAAATKDMQEMEASGVDLSKVNLLVYAGGSSKWHNETLNVSSEVHSIFKLTDQGFENIMTYELASMGDPLCLTQFLEYGYENYPSETYGLILWDHGNGPVMGYGSDIQYGNDALTLPEIEKALQDSPFGSGEKLEFIGFDACLMASVELACVVDDYADYLIASQEVEPGFGWNYAFLEGCGKWNIEVLLETLVDSYINYSKEYFDKNPFFKSEVTLAVMDLSLAKNLEEAVDQLFAMASEDVTDNFSQLALSRVETRAFGRATTGSEYDLVDLQALMTTMRKDYKSEVDTVLSILENMVVYNDSNTVESCGLSLYYPYYNKKYYEASWKESYAELGLLKNYRNYLESYEETWLGTDMKDYFSGRLVANETGSGTYTLTLNEEQNARFADAGFYILRQMGEDGYSVIYYSKNVTNEDGTLKATFDGNVLYYGNDFGEKSIPVSRVLDEVDGMSRYVLFPILTGSQADFLTSEDMMCRLVVNVDPETAEVTVLDFSENTNEEIQTGKREQVALEDWVGIQFYEIRSRYLTRDEDGRIMPYWDWPEGDWIVLNQLALADGLNFSYEPLYDDGSSYYLMFHLMDVQGNEYSSELYPITLEEAPETPVEKPTDVGVLEDSSIMICDQAGVKIYLDLIEDSALCQNAYCFRAENSNDFPVRVKMDDFVVDETISCAGSIGYMIVDAKQVDYCTIPEISTVCLLEEKDWIETLQFRVLMNNTENDQTLINQEKFLLHVSKGAKAQQVFLKYKGAKAGKQELIHTDELIMTLIGAGYELNTNNTNPNGDYTDFKGLVKFENISEHPQQVIIQGVEVNGTMYSTEYMFTSYKNARTLLASQSYTYEWVVDGSFLEEDGIETISQVVLHIDVVTETGTQSHAFTLKLEEK